METRVSEVQVKAIMDQSVDIDEITPFLRGANLLVTEKLSKSGMDSNLLGEIERWLTAHMMSLSPRFREVSQEKIGDVSVSYTGQFGKSFESTSFGQMVLMLDASGILKNLDKKQASINVIK